MTFDQAIPLWREKSRLGQADLGKVLGVSRQHVYHWEKGLRLPPVTLLPELARALGRTLPDVLEPWLQSRMAREGLTLSVTVNAASLSA